MSDKLSESEIHETANIVAKFVGLIHAWKTNDFHKAAQSSDELKELGVMVKIPGARRANRRAVPTS